MASLEDIKEGDYITSPSEWVGMDYFEVTGFTNTQIKCKFKNRTGIIQQVRFRKADGLKIGSYARQVFGKKADEEQIKNLKRMEALDYIKRNMDTAPADLIIKLAEALSKAETMNVYIQYQERK